MENFESKLRLNVISKLNGIEVDDMYIEVVNKFIYYMNAYCAELKCTEFDVLLDNDRYKKVFNLFNDIIFKKEFLKEKFELVY